jgi:hypothetical protein
MIQPLIKQHKIIATKQLIQPSTAGRNSKVKSQKSKIILSKLIDPGLD